MADRIKKWLGGSPLAVIGRLILLSILVGVILAAIGLDPWNIIEPVERLIEDIGKLGFDAVRWLWRYFLLGAVLVIPIWSIIRLTKGRVATGLQRQQKGLRIATHPLEAHPNHLEGGLANRLPAMKPETVKRLQTIATALHQSLQITKLDKIKRLQVTLTASVLLVTGWFAVLGL
jgi:hypothetical protein